MHTVHMPVFNLLSSVRWVFWGFSCHRSDTLHWWCENNSLTPSFTPTWIYDVHISTLVNMFVSKIMK